MKSVDECNGSLGAEAHGADLIHSHSPRTEVERRRTSAENNDGAWRRKSRRQVEGKFGLSLVRRLRKNVVYTVMDKQMFAALCASRTTTGLIPESCAASSGRPV